jgi:hypothetical protein
MGSPLLSFLFCFLLLDGIPFLLCFPPSLGWIFHIRIKSEGVLGHIQYAASNAGRQAGRHCEHWEVTIVKYFLINRMEYYLFCRT